MNDQDQDPQFEKALAYCLNALREDPDSHYKEVRRAARADSGIALKRHVWTAARVQLGLKTDDEADDGGPQIASAPIPRAPALPPRTVAPPPSRHPDTPPPWQPEARPTTPSPERPFSAPPQRPQAPSGDGWKKRPAWAMPQAPAVEQRPAPHAQAPAHKRELPEILKQARNPVEFMVGYLQQVSRDANFDEVAEAAEEFGFTVYPTTFGRAQAIVGIVESPQRVQSHNTASAAQLPSSRSTVASIPEPTTTPVVTLSESSPVQAAAAPLSSDPLSGLLAFFQGLDRRAATNASLRHDLSVMLHVVEEALRAEAPAESSETAEVPSAH